MLTFNHILDAPHVDYGAVKPSRTPTRACLMTSRLPRTLNANP